MFFYRFCTLFILIAYLFFFECSLMTGLDMMFDDKRFF